jgi:hypothetical protein
VHALTSPIDLKDLPIGDVFRDNSYTKVSYNFMEVNNNFYSSEYVRRVADFRK